MFCLMDLMGSKLVLDIRLPAPIRMRYVKVTRMAERTAVVVSINLMIYGRDHDRLREYSVCGVPMMGFPKAVAICIAKTIHGARYGNLSVPRQVDFGPPDTRVS